MVCYMPIHFSLQSLNSIRQALQTVETLATHPTSYANGLCLVEATVFGNELPESATERSVCQLQIASTPNVFLSDHREATIKS